MTNRLACLAVLTLFSRVICAAPLIVSADGSGQFKTVQAAIDSVPEKNDSPVIIQVRPGTYKEHIVVPKGKNRITMIGEKAESTILTDDKNVNFIQPDGKKISTPDSSSTLIRGEDFTAVNVTFANTSGNNGQGLAMYHDADRGAFKNCRFTGWQDTLRVNRGRSYFENCYIEGHVDFIYAHGIAWFEKCHIHCVSDGYITAASTAENEPFGYVFNQCTVTAAPAVKRTFLGRPWRPYANVLFMNTELPAQIAPEGWNNWGKAENEKTAKYAEYKSSGPGARPSERAAWSKQLTDDEAKAVTVERVMNGKDGWNPVAILASATGAAPATQASSKRIRIVLAGDSTVTEKAGWGAGFKALCSDAIDYQNTAQGGRSSKSFRDEGHWDKTMQLKGDFVLIQFGHNDQPGKGPERETDPKTTFRQNMKKYVEEVKGYGGNPILVTSMVRRNFADDGTIKADALVDYAAAVREIGAETKTPVIDLYRSSKALFESMGQQKCIDEIEPPGKDNKRDSTHLNLRGSEVVARLVVDELKKISPELAPLLK